MEEYRRNRISCWEMSKDKLRIRIYPFIITALVTAIGLLPTALSTGIGSETFKPLAIVVIGGLI